MHANKNYWMYTYQDCYIECVLVTRNWFLDLFDCSLFPGGLLHDEKLWTTNQRGNGLKTLLLVSVCQGPCSLQTFTVAPFLASVHLLDEFCVSLQSERPSQTLRAGYRRPTISWRWASLQIRPALCRKEFIFASVWCFRAEVGRPIFERASWVGYIYFPRSKYFCYVLR